MYCKECGREISEPNEQGDCICMSCEIYCSRCGDYCFGESTNGLCEDCYDELYEDYYDED